MGIFYWTEGKLGKNLWKMYVNTVAFFIKYLVRQPAFLSKGLRKKEIYGTKFPDGYWIEVGTPYTYLWQFELQ